MHLFTLGGLMGQVIKISPIITADYIEIEQAGRVLGVKNWDLFMRVIEKKYRSQGRVIGKQLFLDQTSFLQCCQDISSLNGSLFTQIAFLMVEGKLPQFSIVHLVQYFDNEQYPANEVNISLSDIVENREYLAEKHN